MARRAGVYSVAVPGSGRRRREAAGHASRRSPSLLDIVYVLGITAVFVLVGLIGKGVEKL